MVKEEKYLNGAKYCVMINSTVIRLPVTKIKIDTNCINGNVEAMLMTLFIYDLVTGTFVDLIVL